MIPYSRRHITEAHMQWASKSCAPTRSPGKAFVRTVLSRAPDIERLVIFSRDELRQLEMEQGLGPSDYPGLCYLIADLRGEQRVQGCRAA